MKLIIDIPEDIFNKALNGRYKCKECFDAIANGIPIPENATNEEAIRALFPYTIFVEDRCTNRIVISKEWWNAPYQKGGKE